MQQEPLSRIFGDEVIGRLRAAPQTESLRYRMLVITLEQPFLVPWIPVQRSAWASYLEAAEESGLFANPYGKDLVKRLTNVDDDQFRSAMAECQAAWFLSERLGLAVSARPHGRGASELEFLVKLPDGDVYVEVKSPLRVGIADGMVHTLDDSDILERCLTDASKQLPRDTRTLVMLVGRLVLDILDYRRPFVKAFYADEHWVISKETDEARIGFNYTGKFLRVWPRESQPRHRRIGGVLFVQEYIRSSTSPANEHEHRVDNDALMLHNPHALHPLPEGPWGDCPQLVPRGKNLEWTDGYPVGGPT